ILLPAIGGLIVGLLIYFGAREAKGHGVPEVMEAVSVHGGRIRPRVAIVKSLASSVCIGSGGSVGREGPIVQIGSSFGSTIGQKLHLTDDWVRTLVACGAAGGISATFNTPIGGVLFAMEVILGRFVTSRLVFVVISSVAADVISRIFLGSQPSFGIVPYSIVSYWELLPYAILGILGGLVAIAFASLLYKFEDVFDAWHIPQYLKPAIGGIGVGLIGLYSYDLFGVGYGDVYWVSHMSVNQALIGEIALQSLIILVVLKIIATSLSLGSGGSGGVFAPSLFIGAMLGGAFGTVAHQLFPSLVASSGAYALVGMAAVFAGAARAPVTSIIMLFELTWDYEIILPLMLAVVISTAVARSLNRETIYTRKLVRRGIDIRRLEQTSPMRTVTVAEAMTKNFPSVLPTMSVSNLVTKLRQTGHHGFPVVDKEGKFVGMISLSDVETTMAKGDPTGLTVADIVPRTVIVAYPDQHLHEVLVRVGVQDIGKVPVVDRSNPKHLLGVLRQQDVIRAYTKAVTGKHRR
ncbi:MAG: chloride channel protein, partial [Dehalococcoidales bacterium]|nr:chloride channel protein [Dehalococcoidales bacterium]